jgi:hypothetical protein
MSQVPSTQATTPNTRKIAKLRLALRPEKPRIAFSPTIQEVFLNRHVSESNSPTFLFGAAFPGEHETLERSTRSIRLLLQIFEHLDSDGIHIDSTCLGLTCRVMLPLYRVSKGVRRYGNVSLRTTHWVNGGWHHLHEVLNSWKGQHLVYNSISGKFVTRRRDFEIIEADRIHKSSEAFKAAEHKATIERYGIMFARLLSDAQ